MTSVFRGDDNFDTAGGNAVKAWVNFNGTGTVAIRASFNVSSITDNGTGDYTVNFTTALPDANYAAVGTCRYTSPSSQNMFVQEAGVSPLRTTSAIKIETKISSQGEDSDVVNVAIFR